jgi:CRISPR-associated endonuclease/helicase Cas3
MTPPLYAKSGRKGAPQLTLEQHLHDTEKAAEAVFGPGRRWASNWCRFFKLDEHDDERFRLHLRLAALFHDIGKANADFQRAVTAPDASAQTTRHAPGQTIRHEHLSALVLHLPEIRQWLSANPLVDHGVITAAVLSHHFKASQGNDWKWCQPKGLPRVDTFLEHPEVVAILQRVSVVASLGAPPSLPGGPWRDAPPWKGAHKDGLQAASDMDRSLGRDCARRSLLLAVKAAVVVADSVASGLVREGYDIKAWVDENAHAARLTSDKLRGDVLRPRIERLEKKLGRSFEWHRFQELAGQQGPRALLLAACGAGKTLAAWRWAEQQLAARELGHVIFLYPTRGTATEGFRDYVGWAPETDAALLHGTSRYELEAILRNPDEPLAGHLKGPDEAASRLYALGHWGRRYFSATVDQFLSFLEHHYTSVCLLPLLADSALIIDEVHSFDRRMFDRLIAFLKAFDVPTLCMTATLPPSRRSELVKAGLRVFPGEEERLQLADLEAEECHLRYRLQRALGADEVLGEAVKAYEMGQRVLWVVNRVAEAQRLARHLEEKLGFQPLCYHSRFRLCDRQAVHARTVESFTQRGKPAFAVTTQVCEMSLDLDADLLVSEVAPVSSLVQRFGRANRHRARGGDFRATLLVYTAPTPRPYTKEDLVDAERFLNELSGQEISQRALAEALERHARGEPAADGSASFLDGGYFAVPGSFRDADERSQACVLDTDLSSVLAALRERRPYDGYVVNVPKNVPVEPGPSGLPTFLRVVSANGYDEHLGYSTTEEP